MAPISTIRTIAADTALMIAAELNHAVAVDLLLARGADKSLRDKQGKSAADLTSLTVTAREIGGDANSG